MLLQNIEIAIHYSAGLFFVGLALLIFASINRTAGTLIGIYAIYSLTMQLSFNNVLGLGFLAQIFLETNFELGKPWPATGAVILGITGGISKLSLASGIYFLAIKLKLKNSAP
ncbi:hypothetical protein [Ectopseudomonas alcaliphila]|uniref:Uncharacterized protein n=1 Tax=Ectopseudomonas alcaliphila TaxID=101564 RepID=A0ABU4Q799_9GAMM|nr:hypothetical protein [Pseudomonas alcaliphila]MDX5994845.1 hypothetical protein [Pseudomonas alcaliphila]